jgi:sirohydrochlorin ferrochelatase
VTSTADNTAVVVIAHGSRNAEANDAHRATCEALATRTGSVVSEAFLELEQPSLSDAIRTLVTQGHDRVIVLPFFLSPGRHVREHIPALVDEARTEHRGVSIELGRLFGDDPAVLDVLTQQLTDATKDR